MNINLLDIDEITAAHSRAVEAVQMNIPKCTKEDADEIVTSIVALVFVTLKHYLPGEQKCN